MVSLPRSQDESPPEIPDHNLLLKNCLFASRLASLLGIGVGLAVLLGGWAGNLATLRTVVAGYPAMMPNTALGLLLCGAALWFDDGGRAKGLRSLMAPALAVIIILLGAVTLCEFILGRDLLIDRLMFASSLTAMPAGRISISSALSFTLLGSALLLSQRMSTFVAAQYLILLACFVCLFNSVSHFYGSESFRGIAVQLGGTGMAIHTSLALLILSVGALLARPSWGLMATIGSPAPGGVMARRLLPAALLIPVVVGWLRTQGQALGFYDTAFGRALFTPISIGMFAFLIWKCGQLVNRMDEKRTQAERDMRQLSNSVPLMVWTAKPDGESNYFNERSQEYIGLNFQKMRDGGWISAIHPDEIDDVMERRRRALANGEPYSMEYRFKRASDGMYRWHLEQGIPVFGPAGEISRWIGTCTDIHSVKEAEDILRTSESQFRQMADSMPQMVWTAIADGNIDYYNRRWHEYTGMSFEQLKNWGWQTVLHADDLQNTTARWTEAFTAGGQYEGEFRLRRADGVCRWHLGRAQAIRDAQGSVVRWFGTCTDIEDYKQAEAKIGILNGNLEERVRERTAELALANGQLASMNDELRQSSLRLEQSNRELQDFAAVAAHDLQEPLRKVQAFGDRLNTMAGAALDEQGRDYLNRMLNSATRMKSLINDLLRFARVASHAQPFLPVDLNVIAREVLSDLEVRIAETNALVKVGDLPTIEADEVQMRQLLQNLIGNGLKFHQADKPPAVRVSAESMDLGRANGMFHLVVEDNGIGFDEKYLDRIFTVFQRLHGRAEYEGTGVGLAICRKIAQRHGGAITAESAPGQGARFIVTLPLRQVNGSNLPAAGGEADALCA